MSDKDLALERHKNVAATANRWLHEAGFKPIREVIAIDRPCRHQDRFVFWLKGASLLVEHSRAPLEGAVTPIPLYDIYKPIDTTNEMDKLREAIFHESAMAHLK